MGLDRDGEGLLPTVQGIVDPRLLRPFIVLAEELHFGRAARRLHLTQSALSQQIQRLEKQLGVQLVVRDPRRVELSAAGHAFLGGARDALEFIEGAVHEARRAGRGQTTVRIGVDIELPDRLMKRLRLFGSARPELIVRLRIQQQDEVISDLAGGHSDLAVGWTSPPGAASGLTHTLLTTVGLHVVLRREDPLASHQRVPRSSLVERRLVIFRPSRQTRAFYDFFLRELVAPNGNRPNVAHVAVLDDAQAAMLDAVEESGGFTFCVGGDFSRFGRRDLVGLPFDPQVRADVVAMWRGSNRPSFMSELRDFVSDWEQ